VAARRRATQWLGKSQAARCDWLLVEWLGGQPFLSSWEAAVTTLKTTISRGPSLFPGAKPSPSVLQSTFPPPS